MLRSFGLPLLFHTVTLQYRAVASFKLITFGTVSTREELQLGLHYTRTVCWVSCLTRAAFCLSRKTTTGWVTQTSLLTLLVNTLIDLFICVFICCTLLCVIMISLLLLQSLLIKDLELVSNITSVCEIIALFCHRDFLRRHKMADWIRRCIIAS